VIGSDGRDRMRWRMIGQVESDKKPWGIIGRGGE